MAIFRAHIAIFRAYIAIFKAYIAIFSAYIAIFRAYITLGSNLKKIKLEKIIYYIRLVFPIFSLLALKFGIF